MIRFTIPAERFPFSPTPIRTSLGIVEFVDQTADVDDAELAAALRDVPAIFGIVEHGAEGGGTEDAGERDDDRPPSTRAPKAAWVAYAARVHDIPAEEAEQMTKAELLETFGG